ncbi:GspH/FimT family pseudopilin [Variovorax robiniae]|uniref:Type II secretion system protein H n=1 Tax=Variovorax robiniae TaxID=1836199 RepID=A0ABU8XH08_9BURK
MRFVLRSRGFTLIETAVTVVVLAVLLVLAIPSIGTWMDNTRIRNAAESLQVGLQTARLEAVRRNQNVSLYLVSLTDANTMDNSCALSAASGSWVVAAASPATKCGDSTVVLAGRPIGDAGGKVVVTARYSTNNTDKTVLGTTAANTVTFNGFGRVVNVGSAVNRIQVTGPVSTTNYLNLMLIVDAGGGVRMCDPRSSIASNDPRKC